LKLIISFNWRNTNIEEELQVIGVYKIKENADVHLVELIIPTTPSDVQVEDITQELPNQPKDNWQVAYDEHYLNLKGLKKQTF